NQRTNIYSYDSGGRLSVHKLPQGQAQTNIYNTRGYLWKQYDFKGQCTEFVYDQFGRPKAKFLFIASGTFPSNSICYQYNALGQVSRITERFGDDASTNTCDGYTAMVGPPDRGNMVARESAPAALQRNVIRVVASCL